MSKEFLQNDPHSRFSSEDWEGLAIQVLKSCGYGRLLAIGLQGPELVCEFLRHGVDATCLVASQEVFSEIDQVVPGRVRLASPVVPLDFDPSGSFDTVIFLMGPSVPDVWHTHDGLPEWLARLGRSILIVLLGGAEFREERATWDERFSLIGAHRHPLSHEVAPYGGLDEPSERSLLLYERRLPDAVSFEAPPDANVLSSTYPLSFGSEGEACAARYELAAKFVRSSDRVLDTTSPSGARAYLLARTTAASIVGCSAGQEVALDAKTPFAFMEDVRLTFVPEPQNGIEVLEPESFDFIVVENGSSGHGLPWGEVRRVLTPGGRLYFCHRVEDGTSDGLGSAMRIQLESGGLLLERSWLQHARRDVVSDRFVQEMAPESMFPTAGDWVIFLAMKPVTDYRPGLGQVDTRDDRGPNVTAFSRDYENPWLIRGLVAIGLRATSVSLRVTMAEDVLATAPESSADYGAALCVRCYAELEAKSDASTLLGWLRRALALSEATASNPSAFRWQVSLLFVAGLMAMRIGDLALAESTFARVASMDALKFSPLLGTKTVGAALRCGIIAFARGDNAGACREWRHALSETRRLLRDGDWQEIVVDDDRPETFGLPEVAAFVMEGARAAGGLRALKDYPDRPALVWQALHCTQADALQALNIESRSMQRWWREHDHRRDMWVVALEEAKAWLSQQSTAWEEQARSLDEQVQSITSKNAQLNDAKRWLEQQLASWKAEAKAKDEHIRFMTDQNAQLNDAKGWLEQQLASWEAEAAAKDEQLRSVTGQSAQLNEAKAWLEQQLASWEAEAGAKDEQLRSMADQNARLSEAKRWLEQQLASWKTEAGARDEQLRSMADQNIHLDEAKGWLEQQLASWEAEARAKDERLRSMAGQYAQLNEAKRWLEQQLSSWKSEADMRRRELEELAGQLGQMRDNVKLIRHDNVRLLAQRQQLARRVEALQGEIRILARVSNDESQRLRLVESSWFVRLGRKLGLIRIRD